MSEVQRESALTDAARESQETARPAEELEADGKRQEAVLEDANGELPAANGAELRSAAPDGEGAELAEEAEQRAAPDEAAAPEGDDSARENQTPVEG